MFDMAEHVGKKALVIFFYPKDDTPLCTQEACGFRDAYEQFVAAVGQQGIPTATGIFQADMQVELVNDGPVTLVVESPPTGG